MRSDARYKLRGVVRHHGTRAGEGHYTTTSLVLKPPTKSNKAPTHEWFLFNDALVEPIRADEVRVLFVGLFEIVLFQF